MYKFFTNLLCFREDNSHLRQVITELLLALKQQKEMMSSTKKDLDDYAQASANSVQVLHTAMQQTVEKYRQSKCTP